MMNPPDDHSPPPPPGKSPIETRSHSKTRSTQNSTGSRGAGAAGPATESSPADHNVTELTAQLATLTAQSARQDAVLTNITEQLQNLASNFEGLQYEEDFEYDDEEAAVNDPLLMVPNSEEVTCHVNPLDFLMADLPDDLPAAPNANDDEDDSLDELTAILQAGFQPPEYGAAVSDRVAASFANCTGHSLSSEASSALKNRLKTPENLKSIGAPRLNACIWNSLDARARTSDTKAQFLQQWLGSAMSSLATQTDLIWSLAETKKLSKEEVKPILAAAMDSAKCIVQAHREISLRRRNDFKLVRPALALLCSSDVPITEYLFGDKVEDGLKAAQAASNLVQKPGLLNRPLRRFRPYLARRGVSLNVRGGPRRGWHGPQRGRQQQQQARRNPQSAPFQR